MNTNNVIYARTHAELLNELLGTRYRTWMRSGIKLPDGKLLWMIELGNFETSCHWINQLLNADELSERHVGYGYEFESHNTYWGALINHMYWDDSDRVVFEKVQLPNQRRKYIFRGVFRLNKSRSSMNENLWEKISDTYDF